MKKMLVAVLLLLGLSVVTGCAHLSGGVAPSNVPLAPDSYRILGEVSGVDCAYGLLGFIPISSGNDTKSALQKALREAPGATALINVTADTYTQFFILYGRTCTEVSGVAVAPK